MTSNTFRINIYPITDVGTSPICVDIEYEIIQVEDGLEKAKFINIHPNLDEIDFFKYTFPSIFFIDHQNHQILNEDKSLIAKTTLITRR